MNVLKTLEKTDMSASFVQCMCELQEWACKYTVTMRIWVLHVCVYESCVNAYMSPWWVRIWVLHECVYESCLNACMIPAWVRIWLCHEFNMSSAGVSNESRARSTLVSIATWMPRECHMRTTRVPCECHTSGARVAHESHTSAIQVTHECRISATLVPHKLNRSATGIDHTSATRVPNECQTSYTCVPDECHHECHMRATWGPHEPRECRISSAWMLHERRMSYACALQEAWLPPGDRGRSLRPAARFQSVRNSIKNVTPEHPSYILT